MVWNLKQLSGTAMKTSPFNTTTSYPRIKRRKVSVKLWPPRPTSSNIVGRNNVGRCWTGGQTDPTSSNMTSDNTEIYPKVCLVRVREPNNVGRGGQADRSNMRAKKMLDNVGLNVWPDSNIIQHHPSNTVAKRAQHVAQNNVGWRCWAPLAKA